MSINIKIIDSFGIEKIVRLENNDRLDLEPGDHSYLNPQVVGDGGLIMNGNNLVISLADGNTVTLDNFFSHTDSDLQTIKTVWIGDIPISSTQNQDWLPNSQYIFDANSNFTHKPLLITQDNHIKYNDPSLEIPQVKVITLALNTSNDKLDDNDSITSDLINNETASSYHAMTQASFSADTVGIAQTIPVNTIKTNKAKSETFSIASNNTLISDSVEPLDNNDTITVNPVNNEDNTGSGGDLTDNNSIEAVNEAPALSVPGAQTMDEDSSITINGTSITDIDVAGSELEVTLSVSDGIITLASSNNLTFSAGGNGMDNMTFTATLADINTAIASLTYQGDAEFSGADTLNISVNDQGNTGSGGALLDNDSIAITVNLINDAPSVDPLPSAVAIKGEFVLVNHNILQAQDLDDKPTGLTYTITGTLNTTIAFIDDIATTITSFTQQDVDDNRVVFVHDNSATTSADFDFSLADAGEDGALPVSGTMTYQVEDSIQGTGGKDTLDGTNNTDWIDGLGGNDTLSGNDGDDLLWGGTGKDTLNGGDGDDYLSGDDKNDDLNGDDGDDILLGGKGKDTLNGDAGNDSLFGEKGQDTLNGGAGNDLLDGGAKNDTLSGGSGNDTFLFNNNHNIGTDIDTLSDFAPADDILDISELLLGYSDGSSDINDFLSIDNAGSVSVDTDGSVGGSNFVQFADMITAPPTGTPIQVIADMITTSVDVA